MDINEINKLFAGECNFIAGAANIHVLPDTSIIEVAFCGLSNVGKSSLINKLLGRRNLARTSNTPGRTQQLNFFSLNNKIRFVDLPGYGYAKVSKKMTAQWGKLIRDYLRGRPNLKRVFLLVDSRRGLKESDKEIMRLLDESAVSYQLILTKADKVTENYLNNLTKLIIDSAKSFPALFPRIIMSSSLNGRGIEELRQEIYDIVIDKRG